MGILIDQPILIVGAMVVGPSSGPLAALAVALVEKQRRLAKRSLIALAVGFPLGTLAALLATLAFRAIGAIPEEFDPERHDLTSFISQPDFFSFFVAFVAGITGMLSLTSTKSGALIGVLVSVTTIPSAANMGVAAAYGAMDVAAGAAAAAGDQPGQHRRRGDTHPLRPAPDLHEAQAQAPRRSGAQGSGPAAGPEPQAEDWTSSFTRTRSMTESVNSVVEAWPPRSAVRQPAPEVSSTASRSARPALSAPS